MDYQEKPKRNEKTFLDSDSEGSDDFAKSDIDEDDDEYDELEMKNLLRKSVSSRHTRSMIF